MKIEEYITSLRKRHNIIVTTDNGELKIRAAEKALTKDIINEIRSKKSEIVDFFQALDNRRFQQIPAAQKKDFYRLTSAQRRLYFLYELDKTAIAYNMPVVVKLQGGLDKEKLARVIRQLIERHESLRTCFRVINGEPVQSIAEEFDFSVEHFRCGEETAQEIISRFIRPFNLGCAPLLRAGIIEIGPHEHILMVDMHHIISDGLSAAILTKECMAMYSGRQLPDLPLQFRDFAEWQQSDEQQKKRANQKSFWLHELAGEIIPADLPTDFRRPLVKTFKGNALQFHLSPEETAALKALAGKEGATLFMVLLSVFNILLGKLTGQEDIITGTSMSGRNHADLDKIIGMFVNTLPLRNYPRGELPFSKFLQNVKTRTLAYFNNQECSYAELAEELRVERQEGRNPFFDVMFDFADFPEQDLESAGLTLSAFPRRHAVAKFDLTLTAAEVNNRVVFNLEYAEDLFREETIGRFIAGFRQIVAAVLKDPAIKISDIEVIGEEERRQLLEHFNDTHVRSGEEEETIMSLFRKQVVKTPHHTAVVFENRLLTYRELDELSDRLALQLIQSYNIQPGHLVGICLDRSDWLVVALLAVMKAGAAYVPVDPAYPASRKEYIFKNAGIQLLLTEMYYLLDIDFYEGPVLAVDVETTEEPLTENQVCRDVEPGSLAYIIYTSGSTGLPKGVMIAHRSLVNYIRWAAAYYVRGEEACFPLYTSVAFDLTVTSVFAPLVTGGKIVVYKEDEKKAVIENIIADGTANIIKLTPSHLKIICNNTSLAQYASLKRTFIVGGEQLETKLASAVSSLFNGNVIICNEYGPTEATVGCMIHVFEPGSKTFAVPIGRPVANTQVYLLDKYLKPVPPGVTGQLYIGGEGLASGYLGNEPLTNEKFIQNPFRRGARLYKTGDTGRHLPDGNIEFLGRTDEQVKIRGYRIEPGEIENHLTTYAGITQAAIVVQEIHGEKQLVAYYVSDQSVTAEMLHHYLAGRVPAYMVPPFYVALHQLPVTINGKLDKRALPLPEVTQEEFVAPQTENEKILAAIWENVLGVQQVSVNDSFFMLGGDSIKSIQISARLLSAGYELPVRELFGNRTIRELAGKMNAAKPAADQSVVTGPVPLTPVQKWFFGGPVAAKNHFNQSLLLHFPDGLEAAAAAAIFEKLLEHHDALRAVFITDENSIVQHLPAPGLPVLPVVHDLTGEKDPGPLIFSHGNQIQSGISLEKGPLVKLAIFNCRDGSRLLIVIHHLVIDGLSWRILLEDLAALHTQIMNKQPLVLPEKTDPYLSWANSLQEYMKSRAYKEAVNWWEQVRGNEMNPVTRDMPGGLNTRGSSNRRSVQLGKELTRQLLTEAHRAFNTQINDILLTALLLAIHKLYGRQAVWIDMEGHGRQNIFPRLNFSRTVGWFTCIYPVLLEKRAEQLPDIIRHVKETLRAIPGNGLDYLVMKYLDFVHSGKKFNQPDISFNYLGQFDADLANRSFRVATESAGYEILPGEKRRYDWDISGIIMGGQLEISIVYSVQQYREETIEELLRLYLENLEELIRYCAGCSTRLISPADCTYRKISLPELNRLQQRYEVQDVYPLSPMQEGMLFHSLLDNGSDNYFEQITYTLKGRPDMAVIKKSMNELTARYDILRTVFLHEGLHRPLQVVLKERKVTILYKDIRQECGVNNRQQVPGRYQAMDKLKKFDLARDALMRLTILQTADEEFDCIWSFHHILMDGWCMGIIINELNSLYMRNRYGANIELPPVQPYARYIEWLEQRDREETAAYWKHYLSGYDNLATLPGKKTKPGSTGTFTLHSVERVINAAQANQLRQFAATHSVTLNTVFQCAWGLLLGNYNNTTDVVFGSVVSGRPAEIQGIETMIGLFINTVPVRITYSPAGTIAQVLQQAQENALEITRHQYHPLPEIQSLGEAGRALLDHIMVFENYPVAQYINKYDKDEQQQDFFVTGLRLFEQTNYDLTIMIIPGNEIRVKMDYNAQCYEEQTILSALDHFLNIIQHFGEHGNGSIAAAEMLSVREKQQLLVQFNNTSAGYPAEDTIITLFQQQASETPGNAAVRIGDAVISYAELDVISNRFANWLRREMGIGKGHLAAIILERDEYLLPAVFGVLKAGAAYIPVDPRYPADRVHTIIQDAAPKTIISRRSYINYTWQPETEWVDLDVVWKKIMQYEAVPLPARAGGRDAAYVIYTSGSTGRPKGVVVEHHAILNRLLWMQKNYPLSAQDVILQKTPVVFDVSVWELFWWSFTGASLALLKPDGEKDPVEIVNSIARYGVTTMHFVPSMLNVFLQTLQTGTGYDQLKPLKQVFVSGEALKPEQVALFGNTVHRRCGTRLINLYGPTEATVDVSCYECNFRSESTRVPIGKPIDNVRLYVVNPLGRLCPAGVAGELCIAGVQLARGYLNSPALNPEKFMEDWSITGERIYRTGDLVRWMPDGNIEFLGRLDHQVKIRGLRIEPGEIESHLLAHERISDAVIISYGDDHDRFLAAYYVAPQEVDAGELREFLLRRLPAYMVPEYFVHLENFPLTATGKLNRKLLPLPQRESRQDYEAPSNYTESTLTNIWAAVLHLAPQEIGVHDDFFRLGGHSIRAIQLMNELYNAFSVRIGLRDIFENATISRLAKLIPEGGSEKTTAIPRLPQQPFYPASSAQERLYVEYLQNRNSLAYNISCVFAITGNPQPEQIQQAFRALVNRHATLRTSFNLSGDGLMQKVHSETVAEVEELDHYNTLHEAYHAFVRPFDLAKAPLVRCGRLCRSASENYLFIDVHHIVCDGISLNILMNDFKKLYAGNELPPLEITYAEYAAWQKSTRPALTKEAAYWQQALNGELPLLDLPGKLSGNEADMQAAAYCTLELNGPLYRQIRQFTASAQVSDYMFLLSVYYILLSGISGQEDIIIGTDAAGRTQPALQNVAGTFINILPLRMQVKTGDVYSDFLQRVKDCVLNAFDNQEYQFDDMMALLHELRGTGRKTIVHVHFAFANFFSSNADIEGLTFIPVDTGGAKTTQYEFKIEVFEAADSFRVNFIYSKAFYHHDTIAAFAGYYKNILLTVLQNSRVLVGDINTGS